MALIIALISFCKWIMCKRKGRDKSTPLEWCAVVLVAIAVVSYVAVLHKQADAELLRAQNETLRIEVERMKAKNMEQLVARVPMMKGESHE